MTAPASRHFQWRPYLMAGVTVYVFAALISALAIGAAAFIRDPAYHSNPAAILGLSLMAAAPFLVIGIPAALALCAVMHWINQDRPLSRVAAIPLSVGAGLLTLLTLVNFNVELVTPESLAYLLPWVVFGAAFGSVARLGSRDIHQR